MPEDVDTETVASLVALLKANREQQGLSMYRVAHDSGLDERTISKVESGKQSPTLYTLLRIARFQGIRLADLLQKVEPLAKMTLKQIVSGGQTGADRAALDFAIEHAIPHEGWCPKGRKALDGPLHERYQLKETPSSGYLQRTEWNARDSDATVICTLGDNLTGGSKRTAEFATKHEKPWLHIHTETDVGALMQFVEQHNVAVLNVAGSRESKEPGVYQFTYRTLSAF